ALLLGVTIVLAQTPLAIKQEVVVDAGIHTAGVTDFAFTPDGTQLISISKDKTIRVWDLETSLCVKTLRPPIGTGNDGELEAMALSGNGKILAVSGSGYAVGDTRRVPIYIIDLTTDKIVKTLEGHASTVKVLSISHDGSRLVSSDTKQIVHLWDVNKGTSRYLDASLGKTTARVLVAMAPDGQHVAAITKDGIGCWNAHTGEETGRTKAKNPSYSNLAWHPDSNRIAGQAYLEKAIDFIHPDGTLDKRVDYKHEIDKLGPGYSTICFSKDGSRLTLSLGLYQNVIVDTATGQVVSKLPSYWRCNLMLSPNGTRLACNKGDSDSSIAIWNSSAEAWEKPLSIDDRRVKRTSVRWNPDSKEVRWSYPGHTTYSTGMNLVELQPIASTTKSLETFTGT
ncbi:MAG: WD40 repeat domain-containing protein, partial [Gemmataceae bacterium]